MRVLVFDDDAAIGRLVVRVVTMAGMEAKAVTSADAFRQELQSDPPQVIVLDLQLGDTDGVTQLRYLAEKQYSGSLVLVSGFDARVLATARMLGQALGLKLTAVLEKPLQVAELQKFFEKLHANAQPLSTQRLLEAIVEDELSLEFQPIVTRKPKVLKKLEALVRWMHPVAGRINPDAFLPMAETDTMTIDALTEWVVNAAVESYQVLAELGIAVPLSVNLSTQNLHDLSLPDRIGERMRAGGMPARDLCLEITESAAFSDAALTMDILSRIRLKGMTLSIDDFGTGYSSLKLLQQMPFSEIKIDKSFVCDMATSRDSRAIVKTIIDLANNMGMSCVAEGVETDETADLLEQMGVCGMQGYLIAQPMPVEAVAAWLTLWTRNGSPMPVAQSVGPAAKPAAVPGGRAAATVPAGAVSNPVQLTPRQVDVMRALSEGCSVKEIARRLDIGPSTVKVHLSLAYSALGARNRVEAVKRAEPILQGLVDP